MFLRTGFAPWLFRAQQIARLEHNLACSLVATSSISTVQATDRAGHSRGICTVRGCLCALDQLRTRLSKEHKEVTF